MVAFWVLGMVTQCSGVISGFSGIAKFISVWEVYIEIFDSRMGSGIIAVIVYMNNLSAKFTVILVAIVQDKILKDAKNNLLFPGIEIKEVNLFLSIVQVRIISSGYSIFSGFQLLGCLLEW